MNHSVELWKVVTASLLVFAVCRFRRPYHGNVVNYVGFAALVIFIVSGTFLVTGYWS